MNVVLRIGTSTASVAVCDAVHGAECVPNAMGDFTTPVATARAPSDAVGFVVGEAALRKRSLPSANATGHVTALADIQSWKFNHRQYHGSNEDINDESKDKIHAISLVVMSLLGDAWRRNSTHDVSMIQLITLCLSQYLSQPIVDAFQIAVKQGYNLLRQHTPAAGDALPEAYPPVVIVPSAIAVLHGLPSATLESLPSSPASRTGGNAAAAAGQYTVALRCGGMSYSATVLQRCTASAKAKGYGTREGMTFGEWVIRAQVVTGPQGHDISAGTGRGGEEIDRLIMSDFCSEHAEKFIMSPLSNKRKMTLQSQCSEAKKNLLSTNNPSSIDFDLDDEPLSYTLSMSRLSDISRPLCEKMMSAVKEALQLAGNVQPSQVGHVVTYGGGINLPPLMSTLSSTLPSSTVIDGAGAKSISSGNDGNRATAAVDRVTLGAAAFVRSQNSAKLSIFSTPSLAGEHFEENTTEFAVLVELHGGTYGMLMAPGQKYPSRAVKELALLHTRPSSKNLRMAAAAPTVPGSTLDGRLRLIATKADMTTFLCEIGSFPIQMPSAPAPRQGANAAGSSAAADDDGARENPLNVELFVEISLEGCVRLRVYHAFSACEMSATFGPISELAVPLM